ncbi:DUF447 domain-containing protein [Methanothermococcus okinawensis]|uniref:DUF447 family protein n=1 Tax=Methanothermococcus okinawensis (strain DSM 14208 / JCM 11175 / IH1) TaxID=647113 RepID=F8ANH7_METOI|nr:DUF447 domain-containing protein [Methanothermococcus okinawensis]AEH07031.1 protein of unknown function DUF447 [Methanothermococcus okinawensis IH1]
MKCEVVITSKNNKDNSNNRAPIGIFIKGNKEIVMHLYEGSHTYNNLKDEDYFIINICSPYLIAKSVLDDNGNYGYLEYNNCSIPYLKESYKIYLAKITNRKIIESKNEYGSSKIMIVRSSVVLDKDINILPIKPYNRAEGLIVEMAILYSRLNIVNDEKRKNIKDEMEHYFKTIKKVGTKRYIELGKKFLE